MWSEIVRIGSRANDSRTESQNQPYQVSIERADARADHALPESPNQLGNEGRCPLARQNESQKGLDMLVNIYFITNNCNLTDS